MDPETVLRTLRRWVESTRPGDPGESGQWGMVYLDNASSDLDLTPHQFAGYLSVLEQRGLYRTVDNYAWGEVRMKESR